ncbi:MAG: hypothetical protein ACFFE5_12490 [Candidatus Thorarchaeota archaeon]
MAKDIFLGELKEAYLNYQKKNYTFRKYSLRLDIEREFSNGKIFVLKGGNILIWTLSIISSILSALWCIAIVWASDLLARGELSEIPLPFWLFMFIFVGIILFVPTIYLFLVNRMFVVIGPLGVYYRKNFVTDSFQWNSVSIYEENLGIIKAGRKSPPIPTSYIKFHLPNGKKIGFIDLAYRNKEFIRYSKHQMFLTLFHTYYRLGKSKWKDIDEEKNVSDFNENSFEVY